MSIKLEDLHEWKKNPKYPHKIAFRSGTVLYECDRLGREIKRSPSRTHSSHRRNTDNAPCVIEPLRIEWGKVARVVGVLLIFAAGIYELVAW